MVKYSEILKETIDQEEKIRIENIAWCYFNMEGRRQVNDDGKMTVFGDCSVRKQPDNKYPDHLPVQFHIVLGSFTCFHFPAIVSMQGCPNDANELTWVDTSITDLVGAPTIVRGECDLHDNEKLVSIEGCPLEVQGNLILTGCTSLKLGWDGVPNCNVKGTTYIPYHKDLPLLRLLSEDYLDKNAAKIRVGFTRDDKEQEYYKIIQQYSVVHLNPSISRKKAIYDCQYALIKAGFKGNAKW